MIQNNKNGVAYIREPRKDEKKPTFWEEGEKILFLAGEEDARAIASINHSAAYFVDPEAIPNFDAIGEDLASMLPRAVVVALPAKDSYISEQFITAAEHAGIKTYSSAALENAAELEESELRNEVKAARKGVINKLYDVRQNYRRAASAAVRLERLKEEIFDPAQMQPTPTGFKGIDNAIDGGLFPGLYVIGAESGIGKSSFALQIADTIAAAGRDVLYFSLEMPAAELMAKSISRISFADPGLRERQPFWENLPKTARGILAGYRYEGYKESERAHIAEATKIYANIAENLYFEDALGRIDAKYISSRVNEHIAQTGTRPVVIVDYLQIIKPEDPRATDKQNADAAVLALKIMSNRYKLPVVAISSFNRANYGKRADLAAFKESGGIEYAANCLIALSFEAAGREDFDRDEEARKDPRNIVARVLKNRFGPQGDEIKLSFRSKYSYFEEQPGENVRGKQKINAY